MLVETFDSYGSTPYYSFVSKAPSKRCVFVFCLEDGGFGWVWTCLDLAPLFWGRKLDQTMPVIWPHGPIEGVGGRGRGAEQSS